MRTARKAMLPVVERFVEDLRGLFARELKEKRRWEEARDLLVELLKEPMLQEHAKTWPSWKESDPEIVGPRNLLFYEDPDHGFVFNALIKDERNPYSSVHDHGPSWTLYGVLSGTEKIVRYERVDDGNSEFSEGEPKDGHAKLRAVSEVMVGAGDIDFVPPWQIHGEFSPSDRVVGFIVRSQRSGTFVQYRYDAETGAVTSYNGPVQIPYHLG